MANRVIRRKPSRKAHWLFFRNPKNKIVVNIKCKLRKEKKPRHIASEENVRMLYFSPGSPYIPRESFYLHIFNCS
jgi:hypothetical protein